MNINWRVRIRNKVFWLALIPAVLLFIQAVFQIFGLTLDFTELSTSLLGAVDALFVILAILGVVADPTTDGVDDSLRALQYQEPAANAKQENVKIGGTE